MQIRALLPLSIIRNLFYEVVEKRRKEERGGGESKLRKHKKGVEVASSAWLSTVGSSRYLLCLLSTAIIKGGQ